MINSKRTGNSEISFVFFNQLESSQIDCYCLLFCQPGSLYNDGMRPLMYSESDAEDKGIGWVRTGTKIKYYRNDIKYVF